MQIEDTYVTAVEKAAKSTVSVRTVDGPMNHPFHCFPMQGVGSGVVLSDKGHILTSWHVIRDSERVMVALPDGRILGSEVVGVDRETDVAVLKVDCADLIPAEFGDSDDLKLGQPILAIGNPLGLAGGPTVTSGVISSLRRHIHPSQRGVNPLIQTDAAINPGNSGGALVDAQGNLVGINTAILSESGGYQGVGFAVPSNLARRVIDDLLRYGEVRRGSIGAMQVVPLTPQLAEQLGIQEERGVIIWQVGSRAAQEGFQRWDVVTALNGQKIDNTSQFLRLVADARIGSTATVGVIRRGRQIAIKVPITQGGRTR
jgi:S1-C subfamily serine protease